MIRQLVVNNILHRPIRTIVSVIAVGVEVALVILIVGLTSGLIQEPRSILRWHLFADLAQACVVD